MALLLCKLIPYSCASEYSGYISFCTLMNNRHALLLCGCAFASVGNYMVAIKHYIVEPLASHLLRNFLLTLLSLRALLVCKPAANNSELFCYCWWELFLFSGYRHIGLRNELNQPQNMGTLFVHMTVKDYMPDSFAGQCSHDHIFGQNLSV